MRTDWSKCWDEAKSFAKEAYTRVQSETDEDFWVSITFIARHHYRSHAYLASTNIRGVLFRGPL
jgi:hypothetical protein